MLPDVYFTTWDKRPFKTLPGGVRRKVISTDKVMVVKYLYDPGAVFPEHSHTQEQMVVVEKGEIIFDVAGRSYPMGPDSVLVIPGSVPHSAHVVGEAQVESINIFHPVKEEFLVEAKR